MFTSDSIHILTLSGSQNNSTCKQVSLANTCHHLLQRFNLIFCPPLIDSIFFLLYETIFLFPYSIVAQSYNNHN